MKQKRNIFIGLGVALSSMFVFLLTGSEVFFSATLIPNSTNNQAFISRYTEAYPGESIEVNIYADTAFIPSSSENVMGVSFEFSWPKEKVEFLGAILDNTLFEGKGFEISIDPSEVEGKAQIMVFTRGNDGVSIASGESFVTLLFSVSESVELEEDIPLSLLSGEFVCDEDGELKSVPFTRLEGGNIHVVSSEFTESDTDFFFEDNIISVPGKEVVVFLKSGIRENIAGFSFDLEYPESKMQFLGFETENTILHGENFHLITDNSLQNHVGVLGATGDLNGVSLHNGDPFLGIRFYVQPSQKIGENIPLHIRKMEWVHTDTLALNTLSGIKGNILLSNESSLRLLNVSHTSSEGVDLVFSDDIIQADISDITFSPSLVQESTTLEIDGNVLLIRGILPTTSESYHVQVGENVSGNVLGSISPEYNFGFFSGFPSVDPVSHFQIEEVSSLSNKEILVTFTDDINQNSIEISDFSIAGLPLFSAEKTGKKQITLTTGSQSSLLTSSWLTIKNMDLLHDLKSVSGELLSLNVFAFTPSRQGVKGPQIEEVRAMKPNKVEVDFTTPLLGSSITLDAFQIYEQENEEVSLITPETFFELSPDHKTLVFHNVLTLSGENYLFSVQPETIRDNTSDKSPIGLIGNISSFLGQGSFFSLQDFYLESAESTGSDSITLTFSEKVSDESISALWFDIFTQSDGGEKESLTVMSVEVRGNSIVLKTSVHEEDASYFVLIHPEKIYNIYKEPLGVPNSHGFLGYSEEKMRAVSVTPKQIPVGELTPITIEGRNFPSSLSEVRVGTTSVSIQSISPTRVRAVVPNTLETDTYDVVVVSRDSVESRIPNAITLFDPDFEEKMKPIVLSDESYATPFKVPNDGNTPTMLWVRIQDPRGVSDIEKVTADLRILHGSASEQFTLHEFVDDKAWYKLQVTVPSTVPTSLDPTEIPVTVENKTGRKGFGTVEVLVNRDLEESLPPVIESAHAYPERVSPGSSTEVRFQVEVSDPDGGENISRVILDASQVGLGILVLQPLDEIKEDRDCTRSDYSVGSWTACQNSRQTRNVELKPGVSCKEVSSIVPKNEQDCAGGICNRSDWEPTEWGPCVDNRQSREYRKKIDSTCIGEDERPLTETRECRPLTQRKRNIMDIFIPKAHAATIFGNKVWYKSEPYSIPEWVPEGKYRLPLTAIDAEGTETVGEIIFSVSRDSGDSPDIDDISITPRRSIANDNRTEFQIFTKVTDPNGHEDITSVVINLSSIGLSPISMQKGQIEGLGAWYSTEKLVVPRSVLPGFRSIYITATDIDGNTDQDKVPFRVVTPDSSGDAPVMPLDRSYTNPRTFVNDQETKGTLYLFVEEGDSPIAHVTANLGTILLFSPETEDEKENDDDDEESGGTSNASQYIPFLPFAYAEENPDEDSGSNQQERSPEIPECSSTDTFACMIPSVREGERGQWFYLPDLIVRKDVPASQDPYFISVVATDTEGRKTEGEIPIYVSDGTLPLGVQDIPYLVSAVSSERNEVQAFFSSSLDPSRITLDAFRISFFDDLYKSFPLLDIDIRSDGRVVTLKTNYMNKGDHLTLFADPEKLGLQNTQKNNNQADFFVPTVTDEKTFFEMESASSLGPRSVQVSFDKNIKFSTLFVDGSNFKIIKKGTEKVLTVHGAQIKDSKTVILSTDIQESDTVYILRAFNVLDFTGKKIRKGTDIKSFSSHSPYGKNPFVLTTKVNKEIFEKGENVQLTVHIDNTNNPNSLKNVELLSEFTHEFLGVLNVDTGNAFSCSNDESSIHCSLDHIPSGGNYTMKIAFKALSSGRALNTLTARLGDDVLASSSANVVIVSSDNPFLITKTPNKTEAGMNDEVTFRVSVTNQTKGETFFDISVLDDFPKDFLQLLEVKTSSGFSCSNTPSEITCFLSSVSPGQTYSFVGRFLTLKEGMVTNTVVATGNSKQNSSQGIDDEDPDDPIIPKEDVITNAASANIFVQNPFLDADFNGDGKVDFFDFSIFSQHYGTNGRQLPEADFNKDGRVDFLDFSIFSQQYGLTLETFVPPQEEREYPALEENEEKEDETENEDEEKKEVPVDDDSFLIDQ
jgi:hypothetical protein